MEALGVVLDRCTSLKSVDLHRFRFTFEWLIERWYVNNWSISVLVIGFEHVSVAPKILGKHGSAAGLQRLLFRSPADSNVSMSPSEILQLCRLKRERDLQIVIEDEVCTEEL